MAIRVNDRHLSNIEYENTFSILNQYLTSKIKRFPKRYESYLRIPFNMVLNDTYKDIMQMTYLYEEGKEKSIERYRLGIQILQKMNIIIIFSYTMWNLSTNRKNKIKYIKPNARKFLTDLINKEIRLIIGVIKKCNGYKEKEVTIPVMKVCRYCDMKNVLFLNNLSELQKIVYKIAIQTSKRYTDAEIDMLVSLSRSAFFYAFEGNGIFIDSEYTYNRRRKCISSAISDLYAMNRPIKELGYTDVFSEKDLKAICDLITESLKILKSIKASDEKRFADKYGTKNKIIKTK